ncbi:MAG: hypothetical protein GWP58_11195 [Gammaproteobacteria bacterium]|jgi:hypothetical protein|nr:hypothetical protein [Gammaproteobacteria bacterium]
MSVAFMHKYWVLTALFVLAFSLPSVGQEAGADKPAIPGDILIESSAGNVLFPHKRHLKFGCKKCHHQIQAMELDTPHPDYLTSSWINCQDCHKPTSENSSKYYQCSDCHHSEPENISDETLSSKVVVHQSCWICHETGAGAKASEGCGDCHVQEEK